MEGDATSTAPAETSLKRKRSLSGSAAVHEQQQQPHQQQQSPSVAIATSDDNGTKAYHGHGRVQHSRHGHLQINYLVRQFSNDIPIVSYDDTCPNIIGLLNEYNGVFDRHESIASNLGAPSTGAEWVRRFERMFDAPPRIVSHPPSCQPNVTWLDVVAFASAYPDHFTLSPEHHVPRVCELRIKDCDVLISQHDFEAIKSGGLRNMIPSQPVAEDEEKELGALQILEKSINEVVHFADQVALRGRVFARRMGERKAAIVERRSDHLNGDVAATAAAAEIDANTDPALATSTRYAASNPAAVSQAIHDELLRVFNDVAAQRGQSAAQKPPRPPFMGDVDPARGNHMPPPLLNHFDGTPFYSAVPRRVHRRSEPDGPYRAEINARTDTLQRGERIYPPCDRCRRLRIDCLKNLTACAGCTKKHAKCSWRDVKPEELNGTPPSPMGMAAVEPTTPDPDSARAAQMPASRHDQHARHDNIGSYAAAASAPQQPQGSHHPHQHTHHNKAGYEPAFDPALDDVEMIGAAGLTAQQLPQRVLEMQADDEARRAEAEATALANHEAAVEAYEAQQQQQHDEHVRVHEAARSLARAAIESQTANLAAAAAASAAPATAVKSKPNKTKGTSAQGTDQHKEEEAKERSQ